MRFINKVVVITGAAGGIGTEITRRFVGASVSADKKGALSAKNNNW